MPNLVVEIRTKLVLEKEIQVINLQIDLEKYRCKKINNLAIKAKNNKEVKKARICYRAWGQRIKIFNRLKKEREKLIDELSQINKLANSQNPIIGSANKKEEPPKKQSNRLVTKNTRIQDIVKRINPIPKVVASKIVSNELR